MKTFYQNCVFITSKTKVNNGVQYLVPHVWIHKTEKEAIQNQAKFLEFLVKYYPTESIGKINVQPLYMEED